MSKVPLHVGGSTATAAATPPPPVDPGSDSDSDQDRYSLHEPQFVIHAVDDDRRRRLPPALPVQHPPPPALAAAPGPEVARLERLRYFLTLSQVRQLKLDAIDATVLLGSL